MRNISFNNYSTNGKPDPGDISQIVTQITTIARVYEMDIEYECVLVGPTYAAYIFKLISGDFDNTVLSNFEETLTNGLLRAFIMCRYIDEDKKLIFEIPNITRAPIHFSYLLEERLINRDRRLFIPLGYSLIADSILTSSLDHSSNILICGSTGSGKSTFLHQLLCSLIFNNRPEELGLVLIDPKKVELSAYKEIKHLLLPIANSTDAINDALDWVVKEVSNREKADESTFKPIVVAIDEFADCAIANKAFHAQIESITKKGPGVNVFLIMTSQNPYYFMYKAEENWQDLSYKKLNKLFNTKFIFRMLGYASKKLVGDDIGKYLTGRGDMFLVQDDPHTLLRLQSFYVEDDMVKTFSK